MVRWLIFWTLFVGTCAYALWRGGREERMIAMGFVIAEVLSVVLVRPFEDRFRHLELTYIVDIALFIFLIVVSLWSNQFWPLWVAAMQGVTIVSHLAVSFAPDVGPWVYGTAVAIWSYPMLILLAIATFQRCRSQVANETC